MQPQASTMPTVRFRSTHLLATLLILVALLPAARLATTAYAADPIFGFPAFLPGSGNRTADVAVGDLNGDGALDLVLGNYNQLSQVYLNTGAGSFANPSLLSDSGHNTFDVAVGDLNNDGVLDLVLGNNSQPS